MEHGLAQTSALLASLLVNKPVVELANEYLLAIVNSQARQQEPAGFFHMQVLESNRSI